MRFCVFVLAFSFMAYAGSPGEDLLKAPPSFSSGGGKAIPIDFQFVDVDLNFDVGSSSATGISKIEFYSAEEGFPYFDFVGTVSRVVLNGTDVGAASLTTTSSPDGATRLRVLTKTVSALSTNLLELEFKPPTSTVGFSGGGARMVWAMSDVGQDRGFLEQYVPSNFEFDQFSMRMNVEVKGSTSTHRIYTNGRLDTLANNRWQIQFPDYFTTSSFFFHISNANLGAQDSSYQGLEATIPITVYGTDPTTGMARTKSLLKELEGTFGPFAHERVVVYLNNSGGGMEHCGATITSLGALGHELTHSWFARGVMPNAGNSGWIDEAVASWRDNGYPTRTLSLSGNVVNLAKFSPYKRDTTGAAYTAGASFLAGLDTLFPGGLKKVLREVFAQKKRKTITTPEFERLVGQISGTDVAPYFKRYVYNNGARAFRSDHVPLPHGSLHPRALTQSEIEALR